MKAITWPKYGPPEVLRVEEVEKPVPNDNQVLVKVHASTVTAGDCEMRRFKIAPWLWLPIRLAMGVFKPRYQRMGQEFAGVIETVGKNVENYKVGDKVYGITSIKMGGHAEYLLLPGKHRLAEIPSNMTFAEAATLPVGAVNALYFHRKLNLRPGQSLLIVGAGGSIGTYAIQLAKEAGAEVTAVDSGIKRDMLLSTGGDHVIDYKTEDFTKNGKRYDAILEIANKAPLLAGVRSLNPGGCLMLTNPSIAGLILALWLRLTSSKRVRTGLAANTWEDYNTLRELVEKGTIKPVIDHSITLYDMIEGHRYVEAGLKQGNLVVEIAPPQ